MPKNTKIVVRKKKGAVEVPVRGKKRKADTEAKRIRNRQCLELRQTGATYDMIAQQFNLHDAAHARRCVQTAIERVEIEAAKDVVKMDLMRLDEMQMRATHALRQNGDLNQIDRILRLMEFRYRLLGVNDETVRSLQGEHGIATTINNKNQVQIIQVSPETEDEFIGKMMRAVGIDPNSEAAKEYIKVHEQAQGEKKLPMLEGSANEDVDLSQSRLLPDDMIVEGEIVEP